MRFIVLTWSLETYSFTTQDTLYDVSWSEVHEDQLLVASGDGSIKLFDRNASGFPVQNIPAHEREVFSVNWNPVNKEVFCSGSWDGKAHIWSIHNHVRPVATLPVNSCIYSATFSPHEPDIVSTVSADSTVRVFDLRTPPAANHLVLQFPNHTPSTPGIPRQPGIPESAYIPNEVLTQDWNKYRSTIIATGGVDGLARTFDIRAAHHGPVSTMAGHQYAIRKLAWSPHHSSLLLTASYDMTCRVWDDLADRHPPNMQAAASGPTTPILGQQVGEMGRHSEFVAGVDWCLFGNEGWCASAGWDGNLYVWDVREMMRPIVN